MIELDKWVNAVKKQVREVTDMKVTTTYNEELNAYVTIKDVKDLTKPHLIPINGVWKRKLDKNFIIIEYTPIDENYNVRVHFDDKGEIIEYYFDVTLKNEIRKEDGKDVPYYIDLYLDVIYYIMENSTYIHLDDRDELADALKKGKIDEEMYDLAYDVANKLMSEIKEHRNKFVNRRNQDYIEYKNRKL